MDPTNLPLEALRQANQICNEFEQALLAGERPDPGAYVDKASVDAREWVRCELLAIMAEIQGDVGSDVRLVDGGTQTELAANPNADEGFYDQSRTIRHIDAPRQKSPRSPQRTRRRSRGLQIRCPHCSNHVELLSDTPLDSVACDTCGSNFSIVDRSIETGAAEALQSVGRFELISRLGLGAFGTVWKARDTELQRSVAIKIPRRGQLSPDETEQFLREARAVAALKHPSIVPVHEVGREGDTVFIVSDLIRGATLADTLTGKRYSADEAAELCRVLADALDHAHTEGVIHRDLKPSNVMIDHDGQPYIMDFGLAKRRAEEITMTVDGQVVGTPAYMSPEQAAGEVLWVDRRSDVYALGVILYELLTGELPFRGNMKRQLAARQEEEAPNVQSLNSHIKKDLATITAKCLERIPGRRYASAREVADELGRYLQREPVLARPISPIQRGVRWALRRPLQAAVAVLTLALAIGGPAAAVVIEQQRSRLEELVGQKDRLIKKRVAEKRGAAAEAAELQRRLDAWEGRANPFRLWQPSDDEATSRQAIISLLDSREESITPTNDSKNADEITTAKQHLARASLSHKLKRTGAAQQALLDAAQVLEREAGRSPSNVAVVLALADVYVRIAATSDDPARSQWLQKADNLLDVNQGRSGRSEPLLLAAALDTKLLRAGSVGFDQAGPYLYDAEAISERLERAWPHDAGRLYLFSCWLTGQTPYLDTSSFASTSMGVE